MIDILQDTKDIYAEHKKLHMISATRNYLAQGIQKNTTKAQIIMKFLEDWNSTFNKDQFEPVYFSLWEYYFRTYLFDNQFGKNHNIKMRMFSISYYDMFFNQFYQQVNEDPSANSDYCRSEISTSCPELLYKALLLAIEYVDANYNHETLTWGQVHKMEYPNIPFSKTPLRFLFDR